MESQGKQLQSVCRTLWRGHMCTRLTHITVQWTVHFCFHCFNPGDLRCSRGHTLNRFTSEESRLATSHVTGSLKPSIEALVNTIFLPFISLSWLICRLDSQETLFTHPFLWFFPSLVDLSGPGSRRVDASAVLLPCLFYTLLPAVPELEVIPARSCGFIFFFDSSFNLPLPASSCEP